MSVLNIVLAIAICLSIPLGLFIFLNWKKLKKRIKASLLGALVLLGVVGGATIIMLPSMKPTAAGEDWLSGWNYRKMIRVPATAGAGANYTLKTVLFYNHTPITNDVTTISFEASAYYNETRIIAGSGFEWGTNKTYYSDDDGESWSELWAFPTGEAPKNCRMLYVAKNGYIYVSGFGCSLYRSTNGGSSFSKVLDLGETSGEFWAMDEDSSGNLYMSLHHAMTAARVYRSMNNGAQGSWENIGANLTAWGAIDTHMLSVRDDNGWLYITKGGNAQTAGCWRTKIPSNPNNETVGGSWTQVAMCDWRLGLLADNETIYVGTEDGAERIGKFTDTGSGAPFTVTTLKTFDGYYTDGFPIWIRKDRFGILWGGTARCAGAVQFSTIVWSEDQGSTWTHEVDYANPTGRSAFYFATTQCDDLVTIFSSRGSDNAAKVGAYDRTENGSYISLNGNCLQNFSDITFRKSDGITELPSYAPPKLIHDNENATFFVNVQDDLTSVDRILYLYYGKSSATLNNNGEGTFPLFFDDFETDLTKWNTSETTAPTTVTRVTSDKMEGSYGCEMNDPSNTVGIFAEMDRLTGFTGGQSVVLYWWVKLNKTNSKANMHWLDSTENRRFFFVFDTNGKMRYYDTSWKDICDYSADTWYWLEVEIDVEDAAHEFNLWVNGSLEVFEGDLRSQDTTDMGLTRKLAAVNTQTLTGYFDEYMVRKYTTPEPEAYFGFEEIYEATVETTISTGWNNFNATSVDVGKTFAQVNASLWDDSINFTSFTLVLANGTRWGFSYNMHWNENRTVQSVNDVFIVYCIVGGTWTHQY